MVPWYRVFADQFKFGVLQKSDAQWDAAQQFTAKAGEQSRIAQSRTTEAVKFNQTAEEARRAAEEAHNKESEIEVPFPSYITPVQLPLTAFD